MKFSHILFGLLLFLFTAEKVKCQESITELDTLFHAQVGAGTNYTEYNVKSGPWRIHVMDIDINKSALEFRTVKASGFQQISEMKAVLEDEETYVVGGVNGDFFDSRGVLTNAQVLDGELYKKPDPTREILVFDEAFKPWIGTTNFSGEISDDNFSVAIDGINETRGGNEVNIYNRFYGNSTGTNMHGTEIALKLDGKQRLNVPVEFVITRIKKNEGDMDLADDDLVISAQGISANPFSTLQVDDTVSVQINLNPFEGEIIEAIGGSTQFLKDGVITSNWEERHPRTAVGFSQDTSTVYFVVVDGRQSASIGMMLSEMGQFLINIGATHAINLDGGGSSTLVVQDEVANDPSDGIERSVANALFVTIPNPGDGETSRIQLRPGFSKVFYGDKLDIKVLKFDEFHRYSEVHSSEVEFFADENIGTISSNGTFTAGSESGSGYVYATYKNFVDTTKLEIIKDIPTSKKEEWNNEFPDKFELEQNYPNPFNPTTNIKYSLSESEHVRLEIFSITGHKISTLVNGRQNPGDYKVTFNAKNLSSGTYFYRLKAGSYEITKTLTLIK